MPSWEDDPLRDTVFPVGARLVLLTAVLGAAWLTSCSYSYRVDSVPDDAAIRINGAPIHSNVELRHLPRSILVQAQREGFEAYRVTWRHARLLGTQAVQVRLERSRYAVRLESVGPATYRLDGFLTGTMPFSGVLESGAHQLALSQPNGGAQDIEFVVTGPASLRFRPQSSGLHSLPALANPQHRSPEDCQCPDGS